MQVRAEKISSLVINLFCLRGAKNSLVPFSGPEQASTFTSSVECLFGSRNISTGCLGATFCLYLTFPSLYLTVKLTERSSQALETWTLRVCSLPSPLSSSSLGIYLCSTPCCSALESVAARKFCAQSS